jgi:hypothetical protein
MARFRCVLLGLLPIVLISGCTASAQDQPPRKALPQALPTAQEVLDRSVRATGGVSSWLKLTALSWKADVSDDTAKFMTGKLEVSAKAPDKISICLKLNLGFFACRAYDGKVGWGDDAKDGLATLDGPRLDEIKGEADFYSELHRAKQFNEVRVKGEGTFNRLPVYILQGTLHDGRKQESYFATETGLLAGYKEIVPEAADPKTYYYEDYKEIADVGVKVPAKMRIVNSKMAMRMKLYEIVANPQIADRVFAKPEKSARDADALGMPGRPDDGKVVDGVYANAYFGFRYVLPQGWTVHGEETQKVLMETGREVVAGSDEAKKRLLEAASKRTFALLTVFEFPLGTPSKTNRGIQVFAENVKFAPGIATGKDYLELLKKNLASTNLHARFEEEPVAESLDGFDFYRQGGDLEIAGKPVYELFVANVRSGYALVFLFTATSKEGAEEAANSMKSFRRMAGKVASASGADTSSKP